MKKSRLILFPVLVMSIGMMTGCEDQIKNISADFQSQIDGIKSDIDDLKKQITEAKSQIESLKSDMEGKIATVKGDYEKKIADAEAEIESLNTALNNAIKQHADDKKAIEDDYTAKLASLGDAHNADKQALQEDYNNKINALETAYKNKVQEIETSISNLNSSVTSLQNEMNQQILSIQNDYNSKINSLTERVATLEEVKTHTVNFNSEGGSEITSQTIVHGEKASRPANPVRKGFTFKGWTLYGEPWSFIGYSVTEDIYLHAEWERNQYSIYINNNNYSAGRVSGGGTYYYDDRVTLRAYANPGYSFNGWYNSNNELLSNSDQFDVVVESDATYYANFNDGNEYSLNYVAEGWIINDAPTTVKYGQYYALPTPEPRNGYTFNGWSLSENGNAIPMNGTWNWEFNGVVNLYVRSSYTSYRINYLLKGGKNNAENISKYDVTTEFTFKDPERTGYTFKGWFDASGNKVEKIQLGSFGDLVLTAEWDPIKYDLTVTSNDNNKGTVTINGSGLMDEVVSVSATPKEGCHFFGWFDANDYFITSNPDYSFLMKNKEMTLKALFLNDSEMNTWKNNHGIVPNYSADGKQVTYGMYPQSVVTDADLVAKLNEMTNKYGSYYYYNGDFYFKKLADPRSTVITFDNGNVIERGKDYWFKVEPINWFVAKIDGDEAFLVAEDILDNQMYSSNTGVYYDISSIRQWLNNYFYDMSFGLDSSYVATTHVDNSGESTGYALNTYVCPDTDDKVFMLSVKEVNDRESLAFERMAVTTEYGRASGVNVSMNPLNLYHSIYWTRSPCDGYDNYAVNFVSLEGYPSGYIVNSGHDGVRPAITLSLVQKQESSIKFDEKELTVCVGENSRTNVIYNSNFYSEELYNIAYYSSNEEVATIDDKGYVIGVAEGEADIFVYIDKNGNGSRDESEKFDSCHIFVEKAIVYGKIGSLSFNKDATVAVDNELEDPEDPRVTYASTSGVSITVRKNTAISDINVWNDTNPSCRWYVGHKVIIAHSRSFNKVVLTCDSGYDIFRPEVEGTTISALKAAGITYKSESNVITLELANASRSVEIVIDKQIRPNNVELISVEGSSSHDDSLKIWDSEDVINGMSNPGSTQIVDNVGEIQFTAYRLESPDDSVTFRFVPTETGTMKFNLLFAARYYNAASTYFWYQAKDSDQKKMQVSINGEVLETPEENPNFEEIAGENCVQSDGVSDISNPVYYTLCEFYGVEGIETTITVTYLGGGYRLFVAGASVTK